MNFSKNNRLGKLFSLSLVLILMCTLFAGCNRANPSEPETTGSGLNLDLSTTTSAPTSAPTEPAPTETVATGENMGTVTHQMNVRKAPSMDASVEGTLYAGDRVEVTMRETIVGHEWGYTPPPIDGWILMDYVEMDNASEDVPTVTTPAASGNGTGTSNTNTNTGATTTSTQGVITGNGVNIRSEASTNGKIQGSYNKGDVITILETSNGWGRTSRGWVNMNYVNTSGTSNNSSTNNNTNNNTNNSNTNNSNTTGNGSTTVQLRGVVNVAELNIRSSASTDGDRLGSYTYGDRVEIYEKSGNWGRTNKGWISLSYVYQDGTTGSKTATGTITAEGGLNIRSGPGTGYGSVGSYAEGDSVSILEQFTYNGTTWGCTNKGWISMRYVDTGDSDNSGSDSDSDDKGEELYGTVTAEGGLRIRSGAGSSYAVVGSLDFGDEVVVTRRTIADDTTWGRISQGWICLDYVDLS